MMGRPRTQKKRDYVGVLSSVFAIIIGLLVGFVILLLSNPSQAVPGFITILTGALTHGLKGVGQVFYYATPIILTGLSVGFAFKTGLFNIGTPGQFIVGAFAANQPVRPAFTARRDEGLKIQQGAVVIRHPACQ